MEIIETPAGDVTRNCKNYLTDGGDRLVIGGTLEVLDTATVTGLQSGYATEQTAGSVYQATNQAESAATTISDLTSDFNALLQKRRRAVCPTDLLWGDLAGSAGARGLAHAAWRSFRPVGGV